MAIEIATRVDARGLSCPMPIVKTAQAAKATPSGGLIDVTAPISPEMRAGFERFGFHESEADEEPFGRVLEIGAVERVGLAPGGLGLVGAALVADAGRHVGRDLQLDLAQLGLGLVHLHARSRHGRLLRARTERI